MDKRPIKQACYEALFIIFASVFISLITNCLRPDGIEFFRPKNNKAQDNDPVQHISLRDAVEMFNKDKAIFIDSRSKNDFINGHIPGAINLPDKEFDMYIDNFISKYETDTIIITYCDGEDCLFAKNLAEKLFFVGFSNVYYLKNGWSKWQAITNRH